MKLRLPFLHERLDELDMRVADARERAEDATREAETSARRKKIVEKNVVEPLRQQGSHNQFAELIRQSLMDGRQQGNHM